MSSGIMGSCPLSCDFYSWLLVVLISSSVVTLVTLLVGDSKGI